jgi:dienelactone hydrolase
MSDFQPNMLGAFGPWAAGLAGDGPGRLSFRRTELDDVDTWRRRGRARLEDCLLMPAIEMVRPPSVEHRFQYDGVDIEMLRWQLPYGPPTEAVFLKPASAKGRLPGVLALHDHGGRKYFGLRKITRLSSDLHPIMREHQDQYYGGVGWANELAKRGYGVLVHDAYAFGSRRIRVANVPEIIRGELVEKNPESLEEIQTYEEFASQHESLMAKSLFCAGTTWPGVFLAEDRIALDYLCSRADIDPDRVGCGGLSGGGLRTAYLGGIDDRIRCACCVGMMTTWRDYLLNKCYTHTWMIYIPGLPLDLDYPEIFGLRAPLPAMVQSCEEDPLFTLPEMQRADRMLREIYAKAKAADRYHGKFYPGGHKFDRAMQADAFAWFDQWLKG